MTSFQKFIVSSYRWLAVAVLVSVLVGALAFFVTMAVYQVNTSWGAPVIMSHSSPRILSLNSEVFRARQSISLLRSTIEHNDRQLEVLNEQEKIQQDVLARFMESMDQQAKTDASVARKLAKLATAKRGDDARAAQVAQANQVIEASIEQELKAGLITAETAARSRAQAVANASSVTTGRVGTAALEQQIQELNAGVNTFNGGDQSIRVMEGMHRAQTMRAQLSDVQLHIAQLTAENAVKGKEVAEAERLLETLLSSPYFLAANSSKLDNEFAFVPYENEKAVAQGTNVYSCALQFVICSKVGVVKTITRDEERGRHPMLSRDVRGFLVELELTDKSAAKDHVLFFGSTPFFL